MHVFIAGNACRPFPAAAVAVGVSCHGGAAQHYCLWCTIWAWLRVVLDSPLCQDWRPLRCSNHGFVDCTGFALFVFVRVPVLFQLLLAPFQRASDPATTAHRVCGACCSPRQVTMSRSSTRWLAGWLVGAPACVVVARRVLLCVITVGSVLGISAALPVCCVLHHFVCVVVCVVRRDDAKNVVL